MWGAIKTDLFDFINTITEDTTKTLNKVLGEEDENEEEISIQQKLVADLRRSYETYGTVESYKVIHHKLFYILNMIYNNNSQLKKVI